MNLVLFLIFVIVLSSRRSNDITPSNTCTSMLVITVVLIFYYMWFNENLELNLESAVQNNPFLLLLLGDFNAKSSNWCKNEPQLKVKQ